MEAVTTDTTSHLTATRLQHLGQSLAEQSGPRGRLARMQIQTDTVRALLADTLSAVESGRSDAQLLVLEVKAAASEAAAEVSTPPWSPAGARPSARMFPSSAASVMLGRVSWPRRPKPSTTSWAASYADYRCSADNAAMNNTNKKGADGVAAVGGGRVRPEGGHDLAGLHQVAAGPRLRDGLRVVLELRAAGRGSCRRAHRPRVELALGLDSLPATRRRRRHRGVPAVHEGHRSRPAKCCGGARRFPPGLPERPAREEPRRRRGRLPPGDPAAAFAGAVSRARAVRGRSCGAP